MNNLDKTDQYVSMLNNVYRAGTNNHENHNANDAYWKVLLRDVDSRFDGKIGLDFGCGKGRNVTNMLSLAK